MNALRANQLLIISILLTLVALAAHSWLPKKNLELLNNPSFSAFIFGSNNNQGQPMAEWVDQSKNIWGCNVPTDLDYSLYPTCSYAVWVADQDANGLDLSVYQYLIVDINYQGNNERLRISIRNFNKQYSRLEDSNSTKFHSVRIDKKDLEHPLALPLNEFNAADWWLRQYNISRVDSAREITNVTSIGIDFEDDMTPGEHRFKVKHLTLQGSWISRDNWYLMIIAPWLIGILFYSMNQLRLLRQQTRADSQRIYQLSQQNKKLKQQSDEFRRLSTVDPLTQCFNRFGIHQIIEYLLAQPDDKNLPAFSLILVDIDYFKRINDRRGHAAGDRVLERIGRIIQNAIRTNDYVGRWGGEEFIVVLPDTRQEFALAMAEKLRILIFDEIFEPNQPLNVTASFGIGERMDEEDFATVFKRVDDVLYKAKNQGRNCCVMADKS